MNCLVAFFCLILLSTDTQAAKSSAVANNPVVALADSVQPNPPAQNRKRVRREKERAQLDIMPRRVVYIDELKVRDQKDFDKVLFRARKNDTLTVLSRDYNYAVVQHRGGTGRVACRNLTESTYGAGENKARVWFRTNVADSLNLTKRRAWAILACFAVILFVSYRCFNGIDAFFERFSNAKRLSGLASDAQEPARPLLGILPIRRFRRWPIWVSLLFGAGFFLLALVSPDGLQWVLEGGWRSSSPGDVSVAQLLPLSFIACYLLLYLLMVTDSFAIGGVLGGLLRTVYLSIVMVSTAILTMYVLLIVVLIVFAMLSGKFLSGMAIDSLKSAGDKRTCPKCGWRGTAPCPNGCDSPF